MIERKDILSIPYLKKTTFTGSREGLRFRFAVVKQEPEKKEGEKKEILEVTAWEGPYAFDTVLEEQKIKREMDFSEEGIQKGIDWLNGLWEEDPERWRAAKTKW